MTRNVFVLVAALQLAMAGAATNKAPYSGAPFEVGLPAWVEVSPSGTEDAANSEELITRLNHKGGEGEQWASPHACDLGDQADEKKCMNVKGRSCMWTRVESRDPLKRIQASNSYCLPCRLDNEAIPCWNIGAWVAGKQVTNCNMNCVHQAAIMQPNYVCSDETGFISQSQCFSKGAESGSKCMFIAYEVDGQQKSSCGPCQVQGSGGWGCPTTGGSGPVGGSVVKSCLSQCDVLCAGPPACPPTVAPPPPPPPPAPGIVQVSGAADEMLSAPAPFAMPTVNPFSIIQAARDAAMAAGMVAGTTSAPPKVYWPVVYYQAPADFMYSTGPPPLDGPEPPLPIRPALLQTEQTQQSSNRQKLMPTALRRLRFRGAGA